MKKIWRITTDGIKYNPATYTKVMKKIGVSKYIIDKFDKDEDYANEFVSYILEIYLKEKKC